MALHPPPTFALTLPLPTLPASITAPPAVQFTPPPGCPNQDETVVIVTSCFAEPIGSVFPTYTSPDWLTCQVTQLGPVNGVPETCAVSGQTVVNDQTTYYTGCAAGYTAAASDIYTLTYPNGGIRANRIYQCCPDRFNFQIGFGYGGFMSEHDGQTYSARYPYPECEATRVEELSGREIEVKTLYDTHAWEKRQLASVPWDYERDTMYAKNFYYSYVVFQSTHTCYGDCEDWHSYYFLGATAPWTAGAGEPIVTATATGPSSAPAETTSSPSVTGGEEDAPTSSGSIPTLGESTSSNPIPSGSDEHTTHPNAHSSSSSSSPSTSTPTSAAAGKLLTPMSFILIGIVSIVTL